MEFEKKSGQLVILSLLLLLLPAESRRQGNVGVGGCERVVYVYLYIRVDEANK
jgi:hypothetical protein